MQETFDAYLTNMTRSYANFQVMQGYDPMSVSSSLMKLGLKKHNIGELEKTPYHVKKRIGGEELDKQSYYFVKGILADYAKERIDKGATNKNVYDELVYRGFPDQLAKSVVNFTNPKGIDFKLPHGFLYLVSFIWVLSIIFFLAYTLEQDIPIILLSFFPTFIAIITTSLLIKRYYKKRFLIPLAATFFAVLLFIIIAPNVNAQMEMPVVAVLNAGLTFMSTFFIALFYREVK